MWTKRCQQTRAVNDDAHIRFFNNLQSHFIAVLLASSKLKVGFTKV